MLAPCLRVSPPPQAKIESDRLIVSVGKRPPQETGIKVGKHSSAPSLSHGCDFKRLLRCVTGDAPLPDVSAKEFAGFQIALLSKVPFGKTLEGRSAASRHAHLFETCAFSHPQDVKPQAYRNAFDISRRNLLDQLTRMRTNLLRTTQRLIRGQDEG